MPGVRNSFTTKDDAYLVEYLAQVKINDESLGLNGTSIYRRLTANIEGQWPWHTHHPWQSWRARYIKYSDDFDRKIRVYKKKWQAANASREPGSTLQNDERREEQGGEGTQSVRKRKRSPVREHSKEQKRRRIEDIPVKKSDVLYNVPSGFIPVSQLLRSRKGDKGEGSSRNGTRNQTHSNSSSAKPVPTPAQTTYSARLPRVTKTLVADNENEKDSVPRQSPPRSDGYRGEIFDSDAAHELELDPQADQDDEEVDQLLMDIPEEKSGAHSKLYPSIQPVPLFHTSKLPIPSTSVPNPPYNNRKWTSKGGSDAHPVSADSGFFESLSPSTETDRAPRPLKPRRAPKLVEGPFGGARHKQPARRPLFLYGSDSESESEQPPNKVWPPVREKKKSPDRRKILSLDEAPSTRTALQNGFKTPTRVVCKGKEREVVVDRDSEMNLVVAGMKEGKHGREEGLLTEERLEERDRGSIAALLSPPRLGQEPTAQIIDDQSQSDTAKPNNDHNQPRESATHPSRPNSPPMSNGDLATELASSDNETTYDGPLFTQPEFAHSYQSQSQIHTPQPLQRTQTPDHPFDIPFSQPQSIVPNRSGGIAKQIVSQDPTPIYPASTVITTLTKFLTEREARHTQQSHAKSESLMSKEAQRNAFRARGSPVPTGTKKRQANGLDSDTRSLPLAPSNDSPAGRTSPRGQSQERETLQAMKREELGAVKASSVPSSLARPLKAQSPPQDTISGAEPFQRTDDDTDEGNSSMHSLFSQDSSVGGLDLIILDKGKGKATNEPDVTTSIRDPGPSTQNKAVSNFSFSDRNSISGVGRVSSHSKHVDLWQLARSKQRARKSLSSHTPLSTSSVAYTPTQSISMRTKSADQSPLKLSSSDQLQLIERTIQEMVEKYDLPAEYVRYIWKQAGNLNRAAVILAQLKATQDNLLQKVSVRPSSSASGTRAGVACSSEVRSSPPTVYIYSDTTEVRGNSSMPTSSPTYSSPRRRPRNSSRSRDTFVPIILDKPAPDSGYSPPTHSRAGQVALLFAQGRVGEAWERERKRASRGSGPFRCVKPNGVELSTS